MSENVASRAELHADAAHAEAESPRDAVDRDEDRELGQVLRHGKHAAPFRWPRTGRGAPARRPAGSCSGCRSARSGSSRSRCLQPGDGARKVVPEAVPVVRRHGQGQHELVTEQHRDQRQEQDGEPARRQLAERFARSGERKRGTPSEQPDDDRAGHEKRAHQAQPAACHRIGRREDERRPRRSRPRMRGRRRGASRRGSGSAHSLHREAPPRPAAARGDARSRRRVSHVAVTTSQPERPQTATPPPAAVGKSRDARRGRRGLTVGFDVT